MSNVDVSFQSGVELSVVRFTVQEHMSAAFLIQLDAVGAPDLDTRAIAGRGASFAIGGRGGKRIFTGVVTRIAQTHSHDESATYAVTIAPALWLLSRRRNYRVFQHLSVPEIASALLGEWGITPDLRLTGAHPKLEYRVQYGETDYNFLRRQLADAGISFFFASVTDDKGHAETKLVLSDAPQRAEPRAGSLPFVTDVGLSDNAENVSHVTVTSEVRSGKVTLRDHDVRRPTYPLFGRASARVEPEALLEEYVYEPGASAALAAADGTTPLADKPIAYRQSDSVAEARARVIEEELRPGGPAIHFTTSVIDLAPGVVVAITGHPHPAVGSREGVLVVEAWIAGDTHGEWSATVIAVPAGEPFRPPRAVAVRAPDHTDEPDLFASQLVPQKPRVHGIESAIVVGPEGEEIHVDELGRVRVRFHWDREDHGAQTSSCWVRVSQAWAGAGYGAGFLPRVGHEVLVAFVGGDPDLPVIVGRVHSPTLPAPFALPQHKARSGLRTSSQGGGYNEIVLDDEHGQELLSLRAERDLAGAAKDVVKLFIEGSATGIEMSKGRIVLTTGEASIVLQGGEVSVHAQKNLATPTFQNGGELGKLSEGPRPAAPAPAVKPAPAPATPTQKPAPGAKDPPCVKLGKNKKFKGAILEASQRTGVAPHAIASMIDAEAAKTKEGEWNPESRATTSSAVGLTQFLNGTWKEMALRPGTLLNQEAVEAGYVVKSGKAFEIAHGKTDELLAMRNDPRMSIVTGAEYAEGNLGVLEKAGFITSATTDEEKARLAYLAHHEGPGGAKDFLRGTMSEDRAADLLRTNAGSKTAAELTAKHGSARAAYKSWLNAYIDKKIVPSRYQCSDERVDGDEASKAAR